MNFIFKFISIIDSLVIPPVISKNMLIIVSNVILKSKIFPIRLTKTLNKTTIAKIVSNCKEHVLNVFLNSLIKL